ncbi:MAG: SCO family protein [Candidatus Methylomirabilales bacterium]
MIRGAIAALLLLALPCAAAESPFRSGVLEPPSPAQDFTLRTDEGKPFRLHDWLGSVVLLYFGYTSCPDVCPTTLAEFAQVKKQLGPAAQRLRVALVTVDPERDTPKRLRTYTRVFDSTFLGLTGSRDTLASVWKAYGVYVQSHRVPGSSVGYGVDHSATTFVIDANGNLRLAIPFGTSVEDIRHDLQLLLTR